MGSPERGLDAADTGGGEVGLLAVTTVAGNLSGNVVWSGTIHVTGDALVTLGASVTVQPGTVVKFAQGRRLQVSGTMQAVGTADQPIAFTSIH